MLRCCDARNIRCVTDNMDAVEAATVCVRTHTSRYGVLLTLPYPADSAPLFPSTRGMLFPSTPVIGCYMFDGTWQRPL